MAVTVLDLSRRGDRGAPFPELAAEVDWLLASWIAAANAQNPAQLLTLSTNSQQADGWLGWTLRARLSAQHNGLPVELMAQWVIELATGSVRCHLALAAGHDPAAGLGGHGLLSGGRGTTSSLVSLNAPFPLSAVVASSLDPGQEFFAFCFGQHTFSSRHGLPLLIAKDVLSGQWHLALADTNAVIAAAAWETATAQLLLADGLRTVVPGLAHTILLRPAQWSLITPGIIWQDPLPPLQWLNPVVLPDAFGVYGRGFAHLGYARAADGSGWLGLGPTPLVVRIDDPTTTTPTPTEVP